MSDSPRWCAVCNKYGDHHTDRHETSRVTIYFNPFAFTIEENNEMIAKGYEVMPLTIPNDDD